MIDTLYRPLRVRRKPVPVTTVQGDGGMTTNLTGIIVIGVVIWFLYALSQKPGGKRKKKDGRGRPRKDDEEDEEDEEDYEPPARKKKKVKKPVTRRTRHIERYREDSVPMELRADFERKI
jgi:hypothetical protein